MTKKKSDPVPSKSDLGASQDQGHATPEVQPVQQLANVGHLFMDGRTENSTDKDDQPPTRTVMQTMVRRDDAMVAAFQGLMPGSIGEAIQLASHLGRSSAVPTSARSPENALAIILAGVELGLTPMRALQSIVNIKGNLAMKADLQLGLVRRSGTLDYFDEGFEFRGKTDRTLAQRKNAAGDPFGADLILALVEDVPEGKPYGWCTVRRKGDHQAHTRVFSWLDAERFVYNASDDDDSGGVGRGGPRVEKKLSEKSNYRNSPQDMYPKRARVRALQVTHSDVLAGLPAVEALDGVIIDAEVVTDQRPTSTEDQIAVELGVMRQTHPADADIIQQGFRQLDMAIAKRLQLLKQFKGRPVDLVDWLKTEYANRRGPGRKVVDVLNASVKPAADESKPFKDADQIHTEMVAEAGGRAVANAETKASGDETKRPPNETAKPGVDTDRSKPEVAPMTSLADIAAKFTGLKGQSF